MGESLNIQFTCGSTSIPGMVPKLVLLDLPSATLVPISEVPLEGFKEVWDKPASIPPAYKWLKSLYRNIFYILHFSHPALNAIIVPLITKPKQMRHLLIEISGD